MERTDDVRVRARRRDDMAACADALARVHAEDGYPTNWPADPAGWLRVDGMTAAWVAEAGERIVGHVALSAPGAGDVAPALTTGSATVVGRLFVAPEARGRRVGAALLARAAREAARLGTRAVLDVVTTDAAAVALYERLGWEFLGAGQQAWGPDELVAVRCYAAPPA
ncbi:GNAT family N-acetyltransferase [Streptomyces sp. NPDC052225]|uniref:GNAT family N-acetyltransferase n=1 Tax=Streptomyces sp. NPDC052225 TaxID=3154949 RepID=UPI00343B9EC0